jgi:hypothetical protein
VLRRFTPRNFSYSSYSIAAPFSEDFKTRIDNPCLFETYEFRDQIFARDKRTYVSDAIVP